MLQRYREGQLKAHLPFIYQPTRRKAGRVGEEASPWAPEVGVKRSGAVAAAGSQLLFASGLLPRPLGLTPSAVKYRGQTSRQLFPKVPAGPAIWT